MKMEMEMPGQNLMTVEERLPSKRVMKQKLNIYFLT